MEYMMDNRKIVLNMTAGSKIRNLDSEESDLDVKYFVLPTLEDLYASRVYTHFVSTPELDADVQDVRRLEKLLYNSNPAYLDLLFAPDVDGHTDEMKKLIEMREDIARINLSSLFDASLGMYNRAVQDMTKPTSDKVKEMIEKYGYNTKKFMLALHFLRTIEFYHKFEFKNYGKAIWYEGVERDFMIGAKRGRFSFDEAIQILSGQEIKVKALKEDFKSHAPNEETNEKMKSLIRKTVFDSLK